MGSRGRAFDNPPSNISKTKNRLDQSDAPFPRLVKLLYGVLQCIHSGGEFGQFVTPKRTRKESEGA